MKVYSDLEYLKLNRIRKILYKVGRFFVSIPKWLLKIIKGIGRFFKNLGMKIAGGCKDIVTTFIEGDYKTRVSYVIMGFGNATRGQIGRGVAFFAFEVVFIVYMITGGGYWLSMMPTLGVQGPTKELVPDPDGWDVMTTVYHDNSFKILLYSVLTIFFIVAFLYTWRLNIKQNAIAQQILDTKTRNALEKECRQEVKAYKKSNSSYKLSKQEVEEKKAAINKKYDEAIASLTVDNKVQLRLDTEKLNKERKFELRHINDDPEVFAIEKKYYEQINACGKPLKSGKEDLQSIIDDQFHKTLLALPVTGIIVFTVLPIIFMILVAFTNYDGAHNGYTNNLFHWVGMDNFNVMLNWTSGNKAYSMTFGEVLSWTLIWAFFATFSNYFLGMVVAIMINKKGIKFKKVWRTVLVLTIAIPQFISLLYVSKMFAKNGLINGFLGYFGVEPFEFFGTPTSARITVILINIWIGIPYLMLMATGILMNIPEDLYESSRIDGANVWQQYMRITLPYMLFITGPYLLTSFTGNMNNFNVIYLLTGGGPTNEAASGVDGTVGHTDLLLTWLFKITQGEEAKYYMASVLGILVFIITAIISVIVYNLIPSNRNEEDFQ